MKRESNIRWDIAIVLMVVIVVFVVYTSYASHHKVPANVPPKNDPAQQIVVWDKTVKDAPAHYINEHNGAYYYTACGKQIFGEKARTTTIDIAKSEKKLTCDECRARLREYTDIRTTGDQRFIDIQSRVNKTLDGVVPVASPESNTVGKNPVRSGGLKPAK